MFCLFILFIKTAHTIIMLPTLKKKFGVVRVYLVQKETQCFLCAFFLGLKNIDFKNCFISVVLPFYKDLDCLVPS